MTTQSQFIFKPSLRTRLESYLPQLGALTILISTCVTAFLIVGSIRNPVDLKIKATGGTAQLSFFPNELTLDTKDGAYIKLWITSNNPVVFAHINCVYDPQTVVLVESPNHQTSPLRRVIDKTKPESANKKGEFKLVLALDPSQRSSPPQGNFELATLRVRGKELGASSQLHCSTTASSLYNPSGELFAIESTNANILIGDKTKASAASEQSTTLNQNPTPTTNPNSATISVYSADANGDNQVNMFDLVIWRDHYLKKGYSGVSDGDFNEDGQVNGADYAIWLANFAS